MCERAMPTAVAVRTHIRRLPGEEVLAALAVAFGHREDAGIGSPGPPVGIGPGEAESESSLADGSHGVDRPDRDPVEGPEVLPVRSGGSFPVVVGAEWMAECRCRTAEDPVAAVLGLAVVDSCLEADVVQLLPEEMCKLVGVRNQGLPELPRRSQWMLLVASRRVRRLLVEHWR